MKKTFAIVSLLLFAMACAAPPTNREVVATNANMTPAKASAPPMTEEMAIAKEKAIWDTIKSKDYAAFDAMLAADQLEVSPDGVHGKAESVGMVKDFEPNEVTFADWKYMPIDKDLVLVTYSVTVKGKFQGKDIPTETARASSAWVPRDGKWLAVYHQESPVKKAMAMAPAKPGPTPATAGAPLTTGADAEANEKAVWDAFKTKNYDGFATVLDEAFVEVEPDGTHDKAGSVNGVRGFDASKAELSDFKTLALDVDANLVTYTVKTTATMPAERHTSIWSNRNGKWLAVFHQGGTPIAKPTATPSPSASASPKAMASPKASVSPMAAASPKASAKTTP